MNDGRDHTSRDMMTSIAGNRSSPDSLRAPIANVVAVGPVLVVDDDRDLREAVSALLETMGFRVVAAANGREALARIARERVPCLVVLDLEMPIMDGWQFREAMLANRRLARVPVVVTSAHLTQQPRDLAARLHKPFDADELGAVIERHYRRPRRRPDASHRRPQVP